MSMIHEIAFGVRADYVVSLNTGQTLKCKKELIDMVDANDYFGGSYLKASDIKQPTALTMKEVRIEQLSDREKLVVYFDEIEKGFVLNKINTTRIIKQTGSSDTNTWPTHKITLYATEVEYDGKDVPCIRVQKQEDGA